MKKMGFALEHRAFDGGGKIVNFPSMQVLSAGTPVNAVVFLDPEMKRPTTNPVKGNVAGLIRCYVDPDQAYELKVFDQRGLMIDAFYHAPRALHETVEIRTEIVTTQPSAPEELAEVQETPKSSGMLFPEGVLRHQRQQGETLEQTNRRLALEYEDLEVRRPLKGDDEQRRRELYDWLYEFRSI